MSWLALSLALLGPPQAQTPPPLRLVSTPTLHIGVRPAVDLFGSGGAVGVTVQVTVQAL